MKTEFLKYQAQTTPHPLGQEISHARGSYIYGTDGKKYLDFVAGVSACTLGHCHPSVVSAIKEQAEKYLHVMVYGEYAQHAAVELCKRIAEQLPAPLEQTYLVNSGTEAIDGAIKLARRSTGRKQIIAARKAYHGNTYGALSLMDREDRTAPYLPGIGAVDFINFNNFEDLKFITTTTAAVVLETIQGAAGLILPAEGYLKAIKSRCEEVGALLILDEVQPGFGRTGKLFGFQHYEVVPDILVMGKGMGGGMPIGAFTASTACMQSLSDNPKMGHITTFGGHPVIAAAALATVNELLNTNLIEECLEKEKHIRQLLTHPLIKEIRGRGLMLALMLPTAALANEAILACRDAGLIVFWLQFEPRAIRITPPLTISRSELEEGCKLLLKVLDTISN